MEETVCKLRGVLERYRKHMEVKKTQRRQIQKQSTRNGSTKSVNNSRKGSVNFLTITE